MVAEAWMDNTMMTNHFGPAVSEWVEISIPKVSPKRPLSIHIDQLVSKEFQNPEELLTNAVQVFNLLVDIIADFDSPVRPSMGIPLVSEWSELVFDIPQTFAEIESQMDKEPPSLYLVDWDAPKHALSIEEYKVPLNPDILGLNNSGFLVCYHEARDTTGIENNWEFSRYISVDYYPPHLR
jgi:hypothetical protein